MLKTILRKWFSPLIIVDTNVFVAANWSAKSASGRIVDMLMEGKLRLGYSQSIYNENKLILAKAKTRKEFQKRVEGIFNRGVKVLPRERINLITDDPDDNKYLSCALESRARYILTNDHHLLEIKKFGRTEIIKPKDFVQLPVISV